MTRSGDLAEWSARDLTDGFGERMVSPVEALEAALARVHASEEELNAFVLLLEEEARIAARESEARWASGEPLGPLDGVPVSVKDLNWMRGHPTHRGSLTLRDAATDQEDSPAVARLREAGAVFVGKTTTPEFGWKGVTDSPLTGVTRNPLDPTRTPGGSSGGAAVSVATGMCALALGGDGAGSIRIPAAFTGVFGFKPSANVVPYYPPSPLGSMSQVGPLSRSAKDAASMLSVISGPDPRDPLARPLTGVRTEDRPERLSGLRLLYSDQKHPALTEDVEQSVAAALATLEQRGAIVDRVDRLFDDPRDWFEDLYSVGQADLLRRLPGEQHALLDPGFRALAERGLQVGIARYLELQTRRQELARQISGCFARYDAIVTPQIPILPFDAGHDVPPGSGMRSWLDWCPYTYAFNLSGHPAASVPCGSRDGLPTALQVVGPHFSDYRLVAICRHMETALAQARALPRPGSVH